MSKTRNHAFKTLATSPMDAEVYSIIQNAGPQGITRQEISDLHELPINTVCGAVNRLMNDFEIEVCATRINEDSNKPNEVLRLFTGQPSLAKPSRKGELARLRLEVQIRVAERDKAVQTLKATVVILRALIEKDAKVADLARDIARMQKAS